MAEDRAAHRTQLLTEHDAIKAKEVALAAQLKALSDTAPVAAKTAAAPTPTDGAKPLPTIKFGTTEINTSGPVLAKVLHSRRFKTRAGQPANSVSFVDSANKFGRATFIGQPPPVGCIEGAFIEINGKVKIPSRFCAAGFACEVLPKSAIFKVVDPTDKLTEQFLPDGSLPALTTGPQLSAVATLSASNGFEKAVKGKVNVALVVLGPGTNYQGASCQRFKTLCWLSSGQEIWVTVWEPDESTEETMSTGARIFGENLTLGCHDGEVSLSGSPDQFICVDRTRCPTPAIREPMEPFKPRALTETVVRRFFLKHNKAKLEIPGFIANLMTIPDDEIRSKCQARYHAAPEPAHDDFDI